MATNRSPIYLCRLAGLALVLGLPGQEPAASAAGHMPANASQLFRQLCVKCHGADGSGSQARGLQPEIPDFTAASWHARRSDAQLQVSILEGKGQDMPSFGGKLNEDQARSLVTHVRAFAPAKPGRKKQQEPISPAAFEEEFGRLQMEMDRLKAEAAADKERSKPPVPSPRSPPAKPAESGHRSAPAKPSAPAAAAPTAPTPEGASQPVYDDTYCHREDDPEEPGSTEPAEAEPPRGFLDKLIAWVGRLHAPAVHFPIALLTAAAVAELLRLATDQPGFDTISRFCVWFGALTAVVAGILGWCWGHFRLTDASWVMMTHRWLGTSAVAIAGLVLLLSEGSRRPERRRTRLCFRVTLLVVAVLVLVTGFFGGAVVFGLAHYTWPQ
jgi:uncharacterized membrane protein/mono/diheme cytochrome c family protein